MRYYGGKGKLVNFIYETAKNLVTTPNPTVFDMFAGTSAVSKHFKTHNYRVYSNDILTFSYYRAIAYIELNSIPKFRRLRTVCDDPIEFLNNLIGTPGFITKYYSPYEGNERQYVSIKNAKKIDCIRETIENWHRDELISTNEYAYLITCLIEGINLISNVTGTYAAYLKNWDRRALKPLLLTHLTIVNNHKSNIAFNCDANKVKYPSDVDICYLDPPYNGRQYTSNYFFIELIATGWFDKTIQPSGITGMIKFDDKKSDYCSKVKARSAFQSLLKNISSPYVMLSYNNEGIIPHDEIVEDMSCFGVVSEVNMTHKRYRAINQDGTNTLTKESIFVLKRN